MKKIIILAGLYMLGINKLSSQTASAAKAAGVGNTTSVRGVAINGPELGIIRYIQDYTGGIAGYGGNLSTIERGDSVVITGPLAEYFNLFEITPATFIFISSNAKIPAPQVITASQFGEAHEGKLIKITNCTFNTTGVFSGTANYTLTSNGQNFIMRTNSLSNIVGVAIPTGSVDIIGVGSQYCGPASGSGCTTGYQLLLRGSSDMTPSGAAIGITEYSTSNILTVYPNPVRETVYFNLQDNEAISSIIVTDLLGNKVHQAIQSEASINVAQFARGFYNITVLTNKRIYQGKFIVE